MTDIAAIEKALDQRVHARLGGTFRRGLLLVILAWVAFGVLHILVRAPFYDVLPRTDAEEMVAVQTLQVGYRPAQPPLFDWVLWSVQQVLGPTFVSVQLAKYLLTLAAGILFYLATRRATQSRLIAVMAALSPMLLFNVGATIHDQSTHSVALIMALAGTFYGFVRVGRRGTVIDHAVLGLFIGLGILSKHGSVLFAAAVALAFLSIDELRERLFNRRGLVALALAAAVSGPFLVWLWFHLGGLHTEFNESLVGGDADSHLIRALKGEVYLFVGAGAYSLPASLVILAIFPQLLRQGLFSPSPSATPLMVGLWRSTLFALALAAIATAVAGVEHVRSRYLHVVMLAMPAILLMQLVGAPIARRRFMLFLTAVATFQLAVLAKQIAIPIYPAPPFCSGCTQLMPLDAPARFVREQGLAEGTIRTGDPQLGGHMRMRLTGARVLISGLPDYSLPKARPNEPSCVVIWEDGNPITELEDPASSEADMGGGPARVLRRATVSADWPTGLSNRRRSSTWQLAVLRPDHPLCL